MMNEEREDQKSINDLSAEILEEVFLALDAKSLKNCCLVKKSWNNVIGQSSSIMAKLPLILQISVWVDDRITNSWSKIFHETRKFNRKFHTIIFEYSKVWSPKWNEYGIKTLRQFAAECRQIEFYNCDEFSMKSVKFPHLESARISRASNVEATRTIMKALSSSQLKHLSYEERYEGRSGFSEVLKFLSTQTKLTKLDLFFYDRKISFGCLSDIERIQTPLKTLSLPFNSTFEDPEMMVAFLSRFTETLEDLTFYFKCDSAFELIFTKFKKLKSLAVYIDSELEEISFYHKLLPNNSVKKLVVRGCCSDNQEIFNRFIELLPNIETLKLPTTLLFVSNHLKRLTTLHLGSLGYLDSDNVDNFARVYLPSVKTIVFGGISKVGHEKWKQIVDALPNIESMSVAVSSDSQSLSYRSIKVIAKSWPNLISLNLGIGFVAYDQIFIELLRNCKNIKTIEFPESSFKWKQSKAKILKRVKKHGLRLIVHKK